MAKKEYISLKVYHSHGILFPAEAGSYLRTGVHIEFPVNIFHVGVDRPSQLARNNKKFLFQAVRQGARSREYEDALYSTRSFCFASRHENI